MDPNPTPDLLVLERAFLWTRELYERTARFPKRLRHSLTSEMERTALCLLLALTSARYRKAPVAELREADERLDQLRLMLRLAFELQALPLGAYQALGEGLREVGRLVGGWRRACGGS